MTRSLKDWRRWPLRLAVATLAIVFVGAHGALLYSPALHAALPVAALAFGMVVLAVLKHLGLLGALFGAIRRRFF